MGQKHQSIKQKLKFLEQQYDKDHLSKYSMISTPKTTEKTIKTNSKKQQYRTPSSKNQKQSKKNQSSSSLKANLFNVGKQVQQSIEADDFNFFMNNMSANLIKEAKKWKCQEKTKKQNNNNNNLLPQIQNQEMIDSNFQKQIQQSIQKMQQQQQQQQEQEKQILIKDLKPPSKPLGAYILFLKQRRISERQQKLKYLQNNLHLPAQKTESKPAQLWQKLPLEQKDKYYLQYEKMLHKYNILFEEYKLYSGKKKALSAYSRFYKKIYGQLEIQGMRDVQEITKNIKEKWAKLGALEKQEFLKEELDQKFDLQEMKSNLPEKIKAYKSKLEQYENEQKMYDLSKNIQFLNMEKDIKRRKQEQKRLVKIQKKQVRQRQKKAREEAQKKKVQQIERRLLQLRQKQIMKLKLQNYKINGYPKSYFAVLAEKEQQISDSQQNSQSELKKLSSKSGTALTQHKQNEKQNLMEEEQACKNISESESYSIQIEDEAEVGLADSKHCEKQEKNIKKTKKIKKLSGDCEKGDQKPGTSVFKKIMTQMKIIYGFD